jgi:hypothetical protein
MTFRQSAYFKSSKSSSTSQSKLYNFLCWNAGSTPERQSPLFHAHPPQLPGPQPTSETNSMGDDASSNATAALSQQQIPQLLEPLSPAYAIIAASSTTEPAAFEFPSTAKRPLQVRSSELEGKPGFEGVVIHNEVSKP